MEVESYLPVMQEGKQGEGRDPKKRQQNKREKGQKTLDQ